MLQINFEAVIIKIHAKNTDSFNKFFASKNGASQCETNASEVTTYIMVRKKNK